jgi:hypothetical protein
MDQLRQLLLHLVQGRQSSSDIANVTGSLLVPSKSLETSAEQVLGTCQETLKDAETEIDENPQEEVKIRASKLEMKKVRAMYVCHRDHKEIAHSLQL